MTEPFIVTPEHVLQAYTVGVFPMAETRESNEFLWVNPKKRGIIPLDKFHVPKSLKKELKKNLFDVRIDTDFDGVIDGCSDTYGDTRQDTWINEDIRELYTELFYMGFVHTIECWQDDKLVGGLYGVVIGGAFFGESMFSKVSNASKTALCHLVARLKTSNFSLLDTQFTTDHLTKFGAVEIDREKYLEILTPSLFKPVAFNNPQEYSLDILFSND